MTHAGAWLVATQNEIADWLLCSLWFFWKQEEWYRYCNFHYFLLMRIAIEIDWNAMKYYCLVFSFELGSIFKRAEIPKITNSCWIYMSLTYLTMLKIWYFWIISFYLAYLMDVITFMSIRMFYEMCLLFFRFVDLSKAGYMHGWRGQER